MIYEVCSTHALVKLLEAAEPGSHQYEAIKRELRSREDHHPDSGTMSIFTGAEFEASHGGGEILTTNGH